MIEISLQGLSKWCWSGGALRSRTYKSECTDTCNRLHTEYEDYIHNQTEFNPKYSNEWEACNCDVS